MALVALPGARAAAVVSSPSGSWSLVLIDGGAVSSRPIDVALLPGAVDSPGRGAPVVLCRLGSGFALVSPTGVARWKTISADPQRFERADPFPLNAHGFKVDVLQGGLSDDPDAALLFLHEPQLIDAATRYALLRLEEKKGIARWEWTDGAGEPPALEKEDFPIPASWRASGSIDQIRPFIDHGSWVGGRLRLFVLGGLTGNFARWGMDYSIASTIEHGRAVDKWFADEASWGFFTSSGRYLILKPWSSRGPTKGASRLLDIGSQELHAIKLPRGFAGHRPADHDDGTFWLTHTRGWTSRIVACVDDGLALSDTD